MKLLFAAVLMVCSGLGWSAETPAPVPQLAPAVVLKGEVLEVRDVESYTYLRLKTAEGESWAAIGKAPVKKGARVTIEDVMVMENFESKSLKKTFPRIVFGSLAGAGAAAAPGPAPSASQVAAVHAGLPQSTFAGEVKVTRASGPEARTVAEIVTKSAELKDKTVQVRGKVVKFTDAVLGKNWIHLRDGSGSAADKSDDVLVTSPDTARIGEVVLVKGVVRTDKDFGSGYAYKVLIEDARLSR